jgi:hypothetical protein
MNDHAKPLREASEKFEQLTELPDFSELKAHEIAKEDPLMSTAEFEALKVSIKASGIREPITLFNDQGQLWVLDGRNRMNAGVATKHRWVLSNFRLFTGTLAEARQLAAELNDIRRHLSADQRKEKAAKLIAAHPGLSSRALAAMCGVSHTTIVRMTVSHCRPSHSLPDATPLSATVAIGRQSRPEHIQS